MNVENQENRREGGGGSFIHESVGKQYQTFLPTIVVVVVGIAVGSMPLPSITCQMKREVVASGSRRFVCGKGSNCNP